MSEVNLPEGWLQSSLGEACIYIQRGKGPKYSSETNSFPVVNQKAIRWHGIEQEHLKYVDPIQWEKWEDIRFIRQGDILWNSTGTGTIGRACYLTGEEAKKAKVVDSHVTIVRAAKNLDSRFVFSWIMHPEVQGRVGGLYTGTTNQVELSKKMVEELEIPIPPLAEQKVIAEKLDTMLAKVETTKARLERIPELLKTFRQSVLAAAVSGKLTKEWREDKGIIWQSLVIDDIGEVKGGKRLPKGDVLVEEDTGFPYIRAGQLKQGTVINTSDARSKQLFITADTQAKISRYTVNSGDLYITIVGASIGDAGVIPEHYSGANLTENAAKITEFKKPVKSEFLSYWLRSQDLQGLIKLEIKSGAQGKLALKRIKELPVPYTDVREQTQIVRRVEELFGFADSIEQKANATLERVNNLTQSILAKAFRGELTAEWRTENPDLITGENSAEALLEKIKAERETLKKQSKKKAAIRKKAECVYCH